MTMTALLESIPETTLSRLRRLGHVAENVDWPAHLARRKGWQVANHTYQAQQRAQGSIEMEALLGALDLQPPLAPEQRRDVLITAVEVYLQTEETTAEAHPEADGVRIDACRCPLYERFVDPGWHGLSACGCFARIMGWHDALGMAVTEANSIDLVVMATHGRSGISRVVQGSVAGRVLRAGVAPVVLVRPAEIGF
jgi:hypothetical protein